MPTDDRRTFLDFDADGEGEDYTSEEARTRFRLDDELGRGGLGRVHRAWDASLDREVAVKVLLHNQPAARARFQRETLLTARLQHPNIVPVYDGGLDDEGQPYLAMRLVHGSPLEQAIDARSTLSERLELLDAVIDACQAVAYAHGQRITHRDLKPDNILVGAYGETVVIDWGLAKDLDAEDDPTLPAEAPTISGLHSNHSLTRVGSIVGTPSYMAPEQAAGESVDERVDVYALGAVLYHVLSGTRPYAGEEDVVAAVLMGPPASLETLVAEVPPDLLAVVHKAMARGPGQRYADARALAADLERFRNGRMVAAYRYTAWERLVRQVKAHPFTASLLVALVLLTVGGVLGLARAYHIAETERGLAEASRQEVQELRDAERTRLDRITLDQARLLASDRPGEAIQLLAQLSEERPFDGTVRAVYAEARDHHPPQRLQPPPGVLQEVVQLDWRLLVLVDERLWLREGDHFRRLDGIGPLSSVGAVGERLFACDGTRLHEVDLVTETLRGIDLACEQLRPIGEGLGVLQDDGLAVLDPNTLSVLERGLDHAEVVGGIRWLHQFDDGLDRTGDGTRLHIENPQSKTYGLAARADRAAALGEAPPLFVVVTRAGRLEPIVPEIPTDWLSVGHWLDDERLLVGGGDDRLYLVDLRTPDQVRPFELRGAPTHLVPHGEDGLLAFTDERLEALFFTGSEPVVVPLPAYGMVAKQTLSGEQELVYIAPDALLRQSIPSRAEVLVGGLEARPTGVAQLGADTWFAASTGLYRLHGRAFERVSEEPTQLLTTCDGRLWYAQGNTLHSLDGERRTMPGPLNRLRCAADGRSLLLGSGTTLQRLGPDGPQQLQVPVHARIQDTRDGLLVHSLTSGSRLVLPDGTEQPVEGTAELVVPVGDEVVLISPRETRTLSGRTLARPSPTLPYKAAPVGAGFVLGGVDGSIWWWPDLASDPIVLRGHHQYVQALAVDPSGRFLASAAWDDTVRLWDLSVDPPAGRLLGDHGSAVLELAWSPDGTLYSADIRGLIRRWTDPTPLEPDALRREVRATAAALQQGRPPPAIGDVTPR